MDFSKTLHQAAEHGNEEFIKVCLSQGADVNYVQDEKGDTPLMKAAWEGHSRCVALLLEAGAGVNHTNLCGYTALMYAVWRGHHSCAELLIKAGADVNKASRTTGTALVIAARNDHSDCVNLLLKSGAAVNAVRWDGNTALICAALTGSDNRTLASLIKAGADVNTVNKFKRTALIEASEIGKLNKVKFLLKSGASVHTFVHKAKSSQMALLLIAAGATIDGSTLDEYNLRPTGLEMDLKHMCREAIRKHLSDLKPSVNLILQISRIELPTSLTNYLLYYASFN